MFDKLIASDPPNEYRLPGAAKLFIVNVALNLALWSLDGTVVRDPSPKSDTTFVVCNGPPFPSLDASVTGGVWDAALVDARPVLRGGPRLAYPELLRRAGIQGRVMVQAIIDTTGRAEPNSVKVLQSSNPGFDQPAKNYVLKALFRPARVDGRAVRVLMQVPVDFRLTPSPAGPHRGA